MTTPPFLTLMVLPLICTGYPELKLIRQLNNFYNIDHNVFLLDKLVDINRFISAKRHGNFTPQTLYVYDNIGGNITGLETLKEIESKITFLIVVSENMRFETNINLLNRVKAIQRLQKDMKIGVFFSPTTSASSVDDLRKLFEWSWNNKIINIFAVTSSSYCDFSDTPVGPECSLNIFSYNPFGTFAVLNLTGSEAYDRFFISQSSNWKGRVVLLGAPFNYYNSKLLWLTVFSVMNASFKVVENNFSTMAEFFENGIDFVPKIFFNENPAEMNMYPIDIIPMVILVPEALPYPAFIAYIRTVISENIFGYAMITIVVTSVLLRIVRYNQHSFSSFFQSVADVLNLLMNDNAYIKYQKLSLAEVLLLVPLTFVGFIVVNGILSNSISYLTQPHLQPQIETVEDIYRSENYIYFWNEAWKRKILDMLANQSNHTDWSDKGIVLGDLVLIQQLTRYNRSLTFLDGLNYAKALLRIQKQLNIKGYHIPNTPVYKYLLSYPVHREFPFTQRFNEIVHWTLCAGLYDLWRRESVNIFEKDVVKTNLELLKDRQEEAHVETFPVPQFIVYGWAASAVVFVIEIIWKKMKLCERVKR